MGSKWTDELIADLKTKWAAGYSCSQIAADLSSPGCGFTRNAIIGKAHRLGLSGRVTTPAAPRAPRPQRKRRFHHPPMTQPGTIAAQAAELEAAPVPAEEIVSVGRTFAELEAGECRWPLGHPGTREFKFCGNPCDGIYCRTHALNGVQKSAPHRVQHWRGRA
jgi:GcrA cell cycle regulator